MSTQRWPTVIVLAGLLAGALGYDRGEDPPSAAAPDADVLLAVERSVPHLVEGDVGSERWFCAGAGLPGGAEHELVVTNIGTEPLTAVVSLVLGTDGIERSELRVDAGATDVVALRSLREAEAVAAIIESATGGLVVEQRLDAGSGTSVSQCASSPASSWWFPAGATTSDATYVVSVLNPFPDDAVLDVTIETEEGTRVPTDLQGLVVPGGSVVPVRVRAEVTRREQVAVVLEARSGRVVAERVQQLDGSVGSRGLSASLGATSPAESWVLPFARTAPEVGERYVVFNPGEVPAEVDVELRLDDPERLFDLEPFSLTVEPGRYAVVDLADHVDRVPAGTPHYAIVQSRGGVPVVVEQVLAGDGVLSMGPGLPVQATTWTVLPVPGVESSVSVVNVGAEGIAVLSVESLGAGGWQPAADLAELEVGPGRRLLLRAQDLPTGPLRLTATAPVVVARRLRQAASVSVVPALPARGTSSRPDPFS